MTDGENAHCEQTDRLRQDIAELKEENERLRKASMQADAANRAKSDFLAMISHEIRTPMNGVIGLTELLLDTEMDAKQQQFTSLIMTSARNLLTLINSLLDFSKIEAEMMELDIVEFDLRGMVEELMSLYAVHGSQKDVRVFAEIDDRVVERYRGDSYRIRQILVNLLGNGIKFTESGSVVLSIQCTAPEEGVHRLRFEVRDSGPGIPPDKIDRLFKPFSQVDSSSTRRFGGTGLGLSICQKLVELMGGKIGVESALGQGSTFWFAIPMPFADTAAGHEKQQGSREAVGIETTGEGITGIAEDGDGPLILIVEDDETNQFVLRKILERAGARVRIARNGQQAVEMSAADGFALIFMDCQMPVMDGFQATRQIIHDAAGRGVTRPPIIALTADATAATRQLCREVGMDDHLVKPIDFSMLQEKADRWLPEGRLRIMTERHLPEQADQEELHIGDSRELNQIDTRTFNKLRENMGDIRPVVRVFLESLPKRLQELEDAAASFDAETVRRVAHTLKGTGSQFGAIYLSNLCMRLENMAKSGKLDGVELLLAKIRPATDMVAEFLAEELDKK